MVAGGARGGWLFAAGGTQGDLNRLLVAVADNGQGDGVAGRVRTDTSTELDRVGDRLTVDGGDLVAFLQAGLLGRRACRDARDDGAGAGRSRRRIGAHAEVTELDRLTG